MGCAMKFYTLTHWRTSMPLKADLMDLKNDILTTWESRDRCRTLSLRPTFTPSSVRCQ